MSTTSEPTATSSEPTAMATETYTYDHVKSAVNSAADDILDAVDAPDEGIRDAVNLMVTATLYRLHNPDMGLAEIVADGYDEADLDQVLGWIRTAC